ncbi:MAG: stage II sporulation protein M [Candidatus Velthaea sp.]
MREKRFVAARRPRWQRLEELLVRVDARGLRALARAQLDELALGYRAATSDLAMAQGRGYDAALVGYLNRLLARAHAYVYLGTSESGWSRLRRFLVRTFPREARRSWRPITLCIAVTVIAAVLAYRSVSADPANAYALLPPQQIPLVTRSLHDSNFGFDPAFAPAMSSIIISNNIRVAALAFAGGITCGVLTLWILLQNGLMLGGDGAIFARAHFGLDYWATVAPHGVIELTAIQVAGGAGLLLAAGILMPGRARRRDALVRNARRAGTLVMGTAAMLVVAGAIEGFVSPQRFSVAVRIGVGAVTGVALASYFAFAGRASQKGARFDLDVGVEERDREVRGRDVDDADPALA